MTLTQILQKIRSAFYTKAETDATYLKDIAYNTYSRNLILTKGDGTSSEFRVVYSNQAEYAQKDWNGNNITDTYSTKTELTNGLNSKANDANVVHKSGDETINGVKKFTSETVNTSPHAFRHIYGNYGTFWRQDGTNLYLMLTNSGDQYGGWNNFRPLTVNLATGICDINGTATKATNNASGNELSNNIIKGLSVSGKVITYTKLDGSTGTITTQDTNTWNALKGSTTNAAGAAGYVPAPAKGAANRYLRCDGTWQVPPDNNTTYSFSNKAATLVWNTAVTVATVGGVDITVKLPANPNTNTTYSAGTNMSLSGTTFSTSSTPTFSRVTVTNNSSNGLLFGSYRVYVG